jgi:hypothetical protein
MEQEWAPPSDPVFQLVPATFEQQAAMLYQTLGQPVVSSTTFWTVYQERAYDLCLWHGPCIACPAPPALRLELVGGQAPQTPLHTFIQ